MPSALIIESDLEFAGALQQALTAQRFEVQILEDGSQAVKRAGETPPDVVVLSAELPKLSGFSVCNRLKRDPKLAQIPIIILSANSSEETFEQHRRLPTKRASEYLHKPISVEDLMPRILGLLPEPVVSEPEPPTVALENGAARAAADAVTIAPSPAEALNDALTAQDDFGDLIDGPLDEIPIDDDLIDSALSESLTSDREALRSGPPEVVSPQTVRTPPDAPAASKADDAAPARFAEVERALSDTKQELDGATARTGQLESALAQQREKVGEITRALDEARQAAEVTERSKQALLAELDTARAKLMAAEASGDDERRAHSTLVEKLESELERSENTRADAEQRLEAQSKAHAETKSELEQKLESAEATRKALADELLEEKNRTAEALSSASAREKELEGERDGALAEADRLKEELAVAAQTNEQRQRDDAEKITRLSQEMAAANNAQTTRAQEFESARDALLAEHEARLQEANAATDTARAAHASELETAKAAHIEELEAAKATHAEELETARVAAEAEREATKVAHEAELEALRADLNQNRSDAEARLSALRQELETTRTFQHNAEQQMEEIIIERDQKMKEARERIAELEGSLSRCTADIESLHQKADTLRQAMERLEQIEAQQAEERSRLREAVLDLASGDGAEAEHDSA